MMDVIVAEFETPDGVVEGARRARELGYAKVDAFTPFPIPELDEALAQPRSRLPRFVLAGGVTGLLVALLIQWWTNAYDYPLDVGGRPVASWPTYIIIMFETTVLFAGLTAFAGVLLGARLPRLHDEAFDLPGFERTTVDRFWVTVGDPVARREKETFREAMERAGAVALHDFGGEP